jgi:hypothetical protein
VSHSFVIHGVWISETQNPTWETQHWTFMWGDSSPLACIYRYQLSKYALRGHRNILKYYPFWPDRTLRSRYLRSQSRKGESFQMLMVTTMLIKTCIYPDPHKPNQQTFIPFRSTFNIIPYPHNYAQIFREIFSLFSTESVAWINRLTYARCILAV